MLVSPALGVPDERAQSWKPQRLHGSAQFPVDGLQNIVLPVGHTETLQKAVDDFAELLEARTGRLPTIRSEGTGRPKNALYFEEVSENRERGGAFTIRRDRTRVFIRSADASGWGNALYTIAEDLLGARWYWSGDLGFEWVPPQRAHFPSGPWHEAPAFIQRRFHPANTDYARRNRLNRIYEFNHNLARVFGPESFETNPEVFAKVNGRRKVPKGSAGTDPQPDFTQPAAVEIAARAAREHFETNPESASFSLSINDNVLFDTTSETEAVVSPLRYFRRRPDYTNLVFGFMNRVAEQVFATENALQTASGKERYLTALAYYWTEPAPTIPIHPRVMPVLTSDRAQWHDPDYRAEDKALIQAWAASGAERIATWDYYFGAPYSYPRQFNEWIAESLRFMADSGVDVFFSQLPAFWGLDGAKPWLGTQLLWDPYQEPSALLDEFYPAFFGPAAGPMRRFYEVAEAHRNTHEGTAEWIKLYKDESGIALFPPEVLRTLRAHLDAAVDALESSGEIQDAAIEPPLPADRFAQRVEVASRAFRLTERYAAMDRARQALVIACFDEAASGVVADLLERFQSARSHYYDEFERFFKENDYAPARRHLELSQSDPSALAQAHIEARSAKATRSLVPDPGLRHRGYGERNFLGPRLPKLDGWHLDYRPSQFFSVEASAQSEGAAGLRIEGADMLSVFGRFPVVSNRDYLLSLDATWHISLDNRVHLHLTWLDREGSPLSSLIPLRWPIGTRDQPTAIQIPLRAPNNAYDLRIRLVVSRQYADDFLAIKSIDFGVIVE